jgi:PAS domain S-box-containing protein
MERWSKDRKISSPARRTRVRGLAAAGRSELRPAEFLPLTIDLTPVPPYVPLAVSGDVQSRLGFSPGEIVGNPHFLLKTIHPEDRSQFISGLFHLFLRGYHVYEYRVMRKDGSYVRKLVQMHLVRSRKGQTIKIRCRLRPPFFTVGELIGGGLKDDVILTPHCAGAGAIDATIDSLYKIRSVSSSIKNLLGYRKSDLIGVDARELIPPDYQTSVHSILVRVVEGCQDKAQFWTAVKHRNGSLRFLACELKGGENGQGKRVVRVNCHDICRLVSFPKETSTAKIVVAAVETSDAACREAPDLMASLTARELEILHLTVEGLSSTEIGEHFSISPRTVEAHRASIMRKLRVRSIPQLIRLMICSLANLQEM